jgi:NAD(P)-dependent dehydrogenase (short-subunit alcohol dehydrogenase family)
MTMTCLITGATSGIGEAIATRLAARGADVLAVARTAESGRAAAARIRRRQPAARIEVLTADLAVLDQVRSLAADVIARRTRLDVLVLNAAVARPRRELTVDGFETDFATNHLSAFLLTAQLRELLCASAPARVVTVASDAHRHVTQVDFDGLVIGAGFHHLRTYSTTKLLTVLFTCELARRLAGTGVTANAADPGFARTKLGRDAPGAFGLFLKLARPFQLDPVRAADTPVHLATAPDLAQVSGGYFRKCRPVDPARLATDPDAAARLWDLSSELVTRKATR